MQQNLFSAGAQPRTPLGEFMTPQRLPNRLEPIPLPPRRLYDSTIRRERRLRGALVTRVCSKTESKHLLLTCL